MNELHFTWITGLKLFAGLLLLGAWLVTREQAKLDKSEKNEKMNQAEARAAGKPEQSPRIVPRSSYLIVGAALLFLIIVLMWGNESTL